MSESTIPAGRQWADTARTENAVSLALFLSLATALLLRFFVSSEIVNRVFDYTTDTGPFYEKLHPGTYAVFLLAPVVLLSRPFFLNAWEVGRFRSLLRFVALLVALVLYLVLTGKPGSSGFIIDTYVLASVAGLAMLALNEGYRRALGNITLGMLTLSGVIGIFEAITKHRLLPYDLVELSFRPTGLSDHPLTLGAMCVVAIGFVPLTRWRVWVKVTMIFVLLIAAVASGARFSLLASIGEALLMLLFLRWPGLNRSQARRAKAIVLVFVTVVGSALAALLFAAGLLSRFGSTLFDENFMARVSIYEIFNYVSLNDILFGMRGDILLGLVNGELGLPAIESAPVTVVLLLGLPLAIAFSGLIVWIVYKLLKGSPLAAWIAAAGFMAAALSNNMLSTKTPMVAIFVVLLIAFAIPTSRRVADDLR